jgi:hypothetical protein
MCCRAATVRGARLDFVLRRLGSAVFDAHPEALVEKIAEQLGDAVDSADLEAGEKRPVKPQAIRQVVVEAKMR